jgi:hypothetical protein
MAQAVIYLLLTEKARLQSQASLCEFYGGKSGTGTGSSASPSAFPCQYHSTNSPHLFSYLSPG